MHFGDVLCRFFAPTDCLLFGCCYHHCFRSIRSSCLALPLLWQIQGYNTITSATSVDWAIMNDYNDIASNHCGATTVTNLALYFAKRGKTDLKINNSKRDTFVAVHQLVGNGPVMTIAGDAVTYFSSRGYTLNHSSVGSSSAIKTATTNNRPCGILLADGLFAWHWVIGVGWRQYTSNNDFYFRINNNWNNTVNIYYKPGTGSAWWSATAYWVS